MTNLRTIAWLLDGLHGTTNRHHQFGGVDAVRMGDLARRHGITRWKRGPAGTGKNDHLLRLRLRANEVGLYAPHANRAVGDDGSLVTASAMRLIHADDVVVTVDLGDAGVATLPTDRCSTFSEPVPACLIAKYHGDEVRAAVEHDTSTVVKALILPNLWPTGETRGPREAT